MKKLTATEFVQRSAIKHNYKYTYDATIFVNMHTKIDIKCPYHGIYGQRPSDHLYGGNGCSQCKTDTIAKIKHCRASDKLVMKCKLAHPTADYDYSNITYISAKTKVEVVCSYHGAFYITPNKLIGGTGCRKCGNKKISTKKLKSVDTFITQAASVHADAFNYSKVLYMGDKIKVEIVCPTHGSFWQIPNSHLNGSGCNKCSAGISKAERRIMRLLDSKNISYIKEMTFVDLQGTTSNSRLRYDFWLTDYNSLIEYDGEHHFKPVIMKGRRDMSGAKVLHNKTLHNDVLKNEYAINNNLKLLRIPYTQLRELERIVSEFVDKIITNAVSH